MNVYEKARVERVLFSLLYSAFYSDFQRLLIQSGRQPSVPNAADFMQRLPLPEAYVLYKDLGGTLPEPVPPSEGT